MHIIISKIFLCFLYEVNRFHYVNMYVNSFPTYDLFFHRFSIFSKVVWQNTVFSRNVTSVSSNDELHFDFLLFKTAVNT
jgi:hypothetical protein